MLDGRTSKRDPRTTTGRKTSGSLLGERINRRGYKSPRVPTKRLSTWIKGNTAYAYPCNNRHGSTSRTGNHEAIGKSNQRICSYITLFRDHLWPRRLPKLRDVLLDSRPLEPVTRHGNAPLLMVEGGWEKQARENIDVLWRTSRIHCWKT